LKSTINDEFSRLDEKRNTGQPIQKDLVEVYGTIFDSVYWPLSKAGHAPMPWDGENAGGDSKTALINVLQILENRIEHRK
jgi:hypothetical protein